MADDDQLQQRLARVETLVQQAEQLPDPEVRAQVQELVEHLLEFHGAGLARMLAEAAALGDAGRALVQAWAGDELIASLLLLHGLHPDELETRVRGALDKVRPYLQSHGGNVEFLGLDEGVVHLRMQGHCNGCPSSAVTLRSTIEEAIYGAAPDVVRLEVEGIAPPPNSNGSGFVPLEQLGMAK